MNIDVFGVQYRTPRPATLRRTGWYGPDDKLLMTSDVLHQLTSCALQTWQDTVRWRFVDHRNTEHLSQLSMMSDVLLKTLLDLASNLRDGVSHRRYTSRVDRVLCNNILGLKSVVAAMNINTEAWYSLYKLMTSPSMLRQGHRRYLTLLMTRTAWRWGSRQEKIAVNTMMLALTDECCCEQENI